MNFTVAELILYVLMRCGIPTAAFGHCGIGKSSLPLQLVRRRRKELGQPYKHLTITSRNASNINNNPDHYGYWQWDIPISEKDEAIGYGVTINLLDMAFNYALQSGDANLGPRADKILETLRKQYWKRFPENEGRDIFVTYVRNYRFIPPPSHRGGGVHALEELNRDQSGLRGPVCQMGLAGGFLDHVQPPGVWLYASMNPPDGEYEVTPLDDAMMDRFAVISVHSDIDSWTKWAIQCELEQSLIEAVIANQVEAFNPHDKGFELPRRLCTSRSLGDLNEVFKFCRGDEGKKLGLDDNKPHLMQLALSIVGESAGTLLTNFILNPDRESAIPAIDVLNEYGWEPGKGGWDDHYDGLDHREPVTDKEKEEHKQGTFQPGPNNSGITLSDTRKKVRMMVNGDTEQMGRMNLTSFNLLDWLGKLSDRIKKNDTPSDRDFHQWMNFCLYANDLPDDARAGLVVNHTTMTQYRGILQKFKTMADSRNEPLHDDMIWRAHAEIKKGVDEEEEKIEQREAA